MKQGTCPFSSWGTSSIMHVHESLGHICHQQRLPAPLCARSWWAGPAQCLFSCAHSLFWREGAAEFFSHRLPVSVCHLWSPRTIWHTHWYQFRCRIYASCFASEHGLVFREFWPFSSEDPILAPKPGNLSLWLLIWHTAWPLVALSVKKKERVFRTAFYNRINLEMLYQLATVPPAPT